MEQQGQDASQQQVAPSEQEVSRPQPHVCTETCARACLASLEAELTDRVARTKDEQSLTGVFDGEAVLENLALKRRIVELRERFGLIEPIDPGAHRSLRRRFLRSLTSPWNGVVIFGESVPTQARTILIRAPHRSPR